MKPSIRTRIKHIEQTMSLVIAEINNIKKVQETLRQYFENYIVMKKDAKKFSKFLEKRIKEYEEEQSKAREAQSAEGSGASASGSKDSEAV
tara:strand:+ start:994 stop:1266 length:273 start_codon:yes stop_codon:yes gene_type:complete